MWPLPRIPLQDQGVLKTSAVLGALTPHEAPDEKAAELMAAKVFMLNEWQRKRLLVRKHP
jgi:hypothetical protein